MTRTVMCVWVRRWVLGALVAAGLAVGAVSAAASAPTRIGHFRAFTPAGAVVGLRVVQTLAGTCFTGSIGLPRPDAWRCTVGNELFDPCLESPLGAKAPLVCVEGNKGVRLRLTKPLPKQMANSPEKVFFPWRLVLSNGDVCERFTGTAAGAVQGQGLVYGCTSGGTTTEPRTLGRTWTVRYLAKGRSPFKVGKLTQLKLLAVARAIG